MRDAGALGPASFSGSLFAGSYDVSLWTTSDSDLVLLPTNTAKLLDVGCLPKRPCSKRASELSGMWTFSMEGFGELDANLLQRGNAISGTFHGEYDGVFSTITRDGEALRLYASAFGNCKPFGIRLRVVDSCTLVGTAYCSDESNPANSRQVIALR